MIFGKDYRFGQPGQRCAECGDLKQACWKHYIPRSAERLAERSPDAVQDDLFGESA